MHAVFLVTGHARGGKVQWDRASAGIRGTGGVHRMNCAAADLGGQGDTEG